MAGNDGYNWRGGASGPRFSEGMVSSIGLNADTAELAVDPEASAGPVGREGPRGGTAFESGPNLTVRRIEHDGEDRVRPSGRMRLPKG